MRRKSMISMSWIKSLKSSLSRRPSVSESSPTVNGSSSSKPSEPKSKPSLSDVNLEADFPKDLAEGVESIWRDIAQGEPNKGSGKENMTSGQKEEREHAQEGPLLQEVSDVPTIPKAGEKDDFQSCIQKKFKENESGLESLDASSFDTATTNSVEALLSTLEDLRENDDEKGLHGIPYRDGHPKELWEFTDIHAISTSSDDKMKQPLETFESQGYTDDDDKTKTNIVEFIGKFQRPESPREDIMGPSASEYSTVPLPSECSKGTLASECTMSPLAFECSEIPLPSERIMGPSPSECIMGTLTFECSEVPLPSERTMGPSAFECSEVPLPSERIMGPSPSECSMPSELTVSPLAFECSDVPLPSKRIMGPSPSEYSDVPLPSDPIMGPSPSEFSMPSERTVSPMAVEYRDVPSPLECSMPSERTVSPLAFECSEVPLPSERIMAPLVSEVINSVTERQHAVEAPWPHAVERVRDQAEIEEFRRQQEAVRIREAAAKAETERAATALRQIRQEQAREKREEERIQQKLRNLGVCVQGFQWIKQSSGYRCAGGSHFISDSQLR